MLTIIKACISKENLKFILCDVLNLHTSLWSGQVLVSYSFGQFSGLG